MLSALSTITQLTTGDLQRRKRRWVEASVLIALATVAVLFAIGFAASAGAVALARTYDWVIALVVMSAVFIVLAAIALVTNALLARRARRRFDRSAAVKSAALATGLVAARRSGGAALPIVAAIAGLVLANRLLGGDSSADA